MNDEALNQAREKAAAGAAFDEGVAGVRPLVHGEGFAAYLKLIELFAPFDKGMVNWMLRSAPAALAALKGADARGEALLSVAGMGRARWSVAAEALRNLEAFARLAPEFAVSWIHLGARVGVMDQDAAVEYFKASVPTLTQLGEEWFERWARLGQEIAERSWKAAKEYYRSGPELAQKIEPADLEPFVRLGIHIIEKSPTLKPAHKASSMLALGAAAGKNKKLDLAVQYFKSAPTILSRLSMHDLRDWVDEGIKASERTQDKGRSFFSLQTGQSRLAVDGLVKGLELKTIHPVLRSYAEALMERPVRLISSSIFYKNLPGLARFVTLSDGERVFLPSQIGVFADEEMNFRAYKLSLVHELSHIRYGTFEVTPDELAALKEFSDHVLPMRIFEFLEDERVDALAMAEYPGLARDRAELLEAYLALGSRNGGPSVFELFTYAQLNGGRIKNDADDRLARALEGPVALIRGGGVTVKDALAQAIAAYTEYEKSLGEEQSQGRSAPDRLFYRGPLDFELVRMTREGTTCLLNELTDRLEAKKHPAERAALAEALVRIEDAYGLEVECLPWQIIGAEEMSGLFDDVVKTLDEMAAEKLVRRTVHYDEWNNRLDDYNKNWVKVREMDMPPVTPHFYEDTVKAQYGMISQLRRQFSRLRPDRIRRFFREERGDDVDFNALIESVVDRRAGLPFSDRVYIRREKNLRDVSVAFLVDMSYSTSDMLPSGKTIMDVQREGMVMMAEALESIGDQWAVYGFSSSHREKVDFYVVRDFNAPFNDEVKSRFASLRPMEQTRLGAVIRHASALLKRQPSRVRLLVLLSDGRPYDVDYGDGPYAVEDTRRALWEGRKSGMTFYCITVDKRSREYLPYMYGESNFTVIENVEALPVTLPLIYRRLTT
ncbi:MAG: VWA domain-containing protein [Nitrospinae bacterium]|nr:VWA domain-containing protein [Nitrospinota bacterium]